MYYSYGKGPVLVTTYNAIIFINNAQIKRASNSALCLTIIHATDVLIGSRYPSGVCGSTALDLKTTIPKLLAAMEMLPVDVGRKEIREERTDTQTTNVYWS